MARPVVWSVSGLDSGGGAGLAADQRAAEAAAVHLCPVAAALTAQNSVRVQAVHPVPAGQLEAQLAALADDLPPAAIKVGLIGGAQQARVLARCLDRLRERLRVPLVVDPVLGASTGADFADAAVLQAYREELLPRTDVLTPNRREAARLLGLDGEGTDADQPARARALQALGPRTVAVTGGDAGGTHARDWIAAPQATGWLSLPRRAAPDNHGTGCTYASAFAAMLAHGFVAADAAVLAKMLTTSGLGGPREGPGAGPGPVRPHPGFILDPGLFPALLDGEAAPPQRARRSPAAPVRGVYGITERGAHAAALMAGGLRTVQLRIKRGPEEAQVAWQARLRAEVVPARAAAVRHGATLILNDHWREALALDLGFVHLGQEDLLALDPAARREFEQARAAGLRLGVSTHSLWELARAAAWDADYVACGPVWPTRTKAMPWEPQGLGNLAWWVRMAPAPVVGIGGILEPAQLARVAATGAAAGCVVRGLREGSGHGLDDWLQAWQRGAQEPPASAPGWVRPSLR